MADLDLQQAWPRPQNPKPIVLIGAGGIVRDAHLPAYDKAGFAVAGIFDVDTARATSVQKDWNLPLAYSTLEAAVDQDPDETVFDIATPPSTLPDLLSSLPDGASVLMQKPMGGDLEEARAIRQIVDDRNLKAAVNFQLRFSPMMMAAADAIEQGFLGELLEIDVQVNIFTPWHLFPFLRAMHRVEISVHSIHYLDLIRSIAGNPQGVFARTMGDPRSSDYAQTRTSALLDYGTGLRVLVNVNHNHRGGNRFQIAQFRFEGTKASMVVKLGVLYDYPNGEPDEIWYCPNGGDWQSIPLAGTWFPDAFIGTMSNVQRHAAGEDQELVSSAADAFETMALVEACYRANTVSGVPLPLD